MGVTTNYDHPFPEPTGFVKIGPADFEALADSIDGKHPGFSAGLLGPRPVSTPGSPGIAGRLYRATDTAQIFQDTGTSWVELAKAPVVDGDLASPNNGVPRVVFMVGGSYISPGAVAGTYLLMPGEGVVLTSQGHVAPIWIPDTADVAVAGKTTQVRLVTFLILNTASPGVNFTAGLNHIAAASGNASGITFTLGGAISTVFTAPVGTSSPRGESAWTNLASLAAGSYCFTIAPSGTTAASSVVSVTSQLEMRHI